MMAHSVKTRAGIMAIVLGAVFLLPVAYGAKSQSRGVRLSWPNKKGVYVANSSKTIPAFPRTVSGYRSENDKDFWGNTFKSTGSLRVFEGQAWETIYEFPNTMNGCSAGIFMIRWRSANPDVRIATNVGYSTDVTSGTTRVGGFGYMSGTNCEQPLFKFSGVRNSNGSNLADVYYELKFWQAAP